MKTNKLFEDVFMDIDWSLYDDKTTELSGVGEKIYRTASNAIAKWHPKTKEELVEAIEEELANGNTDLNCIDTSEITDMSELFYKNGGIYLSEEQQRTLDVSEWDVSNVRDMSCMFCLCTNFNQDLSGWDVRNVENMCGMFKNCTNFNKDLSGWNVSNVKKMNYMFWGCKNFNQDLSKWDVRNVENTVFMFLGCENFNQDLSGWDVRNVENMVFMFAGCTKFNQDLSGWDVREDGDMGWMFDGCTKLKENGLIPDWFKHKYKYR